MRPTRWTRKRRVTQYGKGGWHVHLRYHQISYTDPFTGNAWSSDGWRAGRRRSWRVALRRVLDMRAANQPARRTT